MAHESYQLGSRNGNAKLNEQDVEIIRWRAQKKRDELAEIDALIDANAHKGVDVDGYSVDLQ